MDTAGSSSRQVEGEEVDVEWLSLIKTNYDVNVRLSDRIPLDGLPQECNLLAVSNIWGLVIAGTENSVNIYRLSEFQSQLEGAAKDATPAGTPIQTISLPARPIWVRLAMNEERLLVSTANGTGLHIFRLADVLRGQISPYHSFTSNIPSHLIDLLPNPAVDVPARYVALLAREGMVLADIEDKRLLDPVAGPFTSGCWSAKGKQIVLGTPDGRLVQYTPEGVAKAEIPPPAMKNPSYPSSVQWLDTHLFLVSYAPVNGRPDVSLDVFVINRNKSEITYTKFYDPLNTIGVRGRSGAFRYYAGLRNWGDQTKHLGFLMSGLASEVAVMHGTVDEGGVPNWEALILDERARGIMPIGKKGVSEDTSCIGMELDLTSTKAIRRGIVGGIEQADLPPAPRLLVYGQNGVVISFDIQDSNGGGYPGMMTSRDILAESGGDDDGMISGISTPGTITPTPASTQPSAFNGFGSALSSSFGAPSPPGSQPTGNAFGQNTSSAFGASSGGFGGSSQNSASAFSGFGQTSTTSASTPSKPVSAFDASNSSFGQQSTTPSSTPAKTSAFGQASTSSSSGFGAFGSSSGFGQSSTPTAASTTPMSTPAKSVGFGQSAFGQSPAPPTSSAFGAPAFGQKPSFGQTSNPTGFGQSAFGQSPSAPAASAFASIPTPSTGGFGAFGNSKPAASNTGFGVNTSSFGAKPGGFGSGSAFGGGTAFGASSGFGQSAFGQPAAPAPKPVQQPASGGFAGFGPQGTSGGAFSFGGFGQQSNSTPPPAPSSPPMGDDFGLDSFASALESSSKPDVPGLHDDSPPTSPIIGTRKPGGIDEFDSPPNSPPSSQSKPQQQQPSSSSAPSFIKPATAFGGSSSAFTGFGQTPTAAKTVASEPPKPAQSTPAAFGGSAFGQSSKPVTPTAFGSSAFGQSSKPVAGAFGQTSIPSSGGFANISGGFGGFAPKTQNTSLSTPASGGFAGFGPGAGSRPATSSGGFGAAANPQSGGFGALLSQKPEAKSGGSAFGAGSGFGTGKQTQTQSPASTTAIKSSETVKPVEEVKSSLSDIPISPPQSSSPSVESETEAEGYVVPEPAIIPSGYDKPSAPAETVPPLSSASTPATPVPSSTSPEVDEAVLPAGYDKPTLAVTPDAAIIPAGYDTSSPSGVPASTTSEPPAAAKQTALPEPSATEEGEQEAEEAATVPLPEQSANTPGSVDDDDDDDDDDDEGVVVSAPEVEDAGEVIDNRDHTVFVDSVWITGEGEVEEVEDDGYYDGEEEEGESGVYEDEEEDEDEQVDEEGSEEEEEVTPESSEAEEDAEAEEEDDTETVKPVTSSTSAWFANPPKSTIPDSPESTTTASSSQSTPAPAPVVDQAKTQTNKFSFANRHAARTASPLGSQPPHVPQETATPPLSPTKPETKLAVPSTESEGESTKPSTSLFGGKTEAKPLFGLGMGRPPSVPAIAPVVEEKAKSEKESAPGAFSFGAPRSTSVSAAPAEQKPFGSFGFGLGQPPAAVAASAAKPAFNFAPSQPADKGPALQSATIQASSSLFSQAPPSKSSTPSNSLFASSPTPSAAVPPKPEAKAVPPPPPMTTFTVPPRQVVPPIAQRKEDDKATMAAVLEGMILDLKSETKQLQALLEAAEKHHNVMKESNFVKIGEADLRNHKALPFTSVKDTSAIADSLLKRLKEWKGQDTGVERKLAELQSLLLKTDMRSGQLEQFAKARDDPSVIKVIEVTQLSAQQLSDQSRINKAVQDVETGLEDLEMGLAGLKRRVEDVSNGLTPGSASVERLEKSVKNLDGTIQERQRTLDDLSKRFQSIDLKSSPSRATPKRPPSQYISFGTPIAAPSSPTKRIPLPVPSAILADVKSAISDNPIAGLVDRLKGRKTRLTKASSTTRSTLFSHSAKSALEIDTIPTPSPLPSRPEPTRKTTKTETPSSDPPIKEEPQDPSSPTPASPSPFSAFSGITFSLDPGPIASSLPRSGSGSSRGSASNRQHAPAAKLDMSFASTGNAQSSGGFDFALPAPNTGSVKKDGEPSGFFSLSGYSAK